MEACVGSSAFLCRSIRLPCRIATRRRSGCGAPIFRVAVAASALSPPEGKGMPSGVGGNVVVATANSNYVVPLDKSSPITRPLAEILRDLNKRVPDQIINAEENSIAWYHVNRMLSFYAPGWCGEVRDVVFSDNGSVTVVYRVTVRGTDGEAYRESTGTVSVTDGGFQDPVAAAEEKAFCRACARLGFGLYLYHVDGVLERTSQTS